jgi:hypothetical protein
MLTVYEVDGEGKTGGKYYWLALVLKYKLAYSNFLCVCINPSIYADMCAHMCAYIFPYRFAYICAVM